MRLHDHDLEGRVLGALLEGPALFEQAIADGVDEHAFTYMTHRPVFRARRALATGGLPQIVEQLKHVGDLDLAGGPAAIANLYGLMMPDRDVPAGWRVLQALQRGREAWNALPASERVPRDMGDGAMGVRNLVSTAFGELPEAPPRDMVIAALRDLAEALRGRDSLDHAGARHEAVERLKEHGFAPQEAQDLVRAALRDDANGSPPDSLQGRALALTDPEPWPDPVDGAALLDEIVAVIRHYVVVAKHVAEAATLWVLLTYCLDHVDVAVRLTLTSPTKACGKTRLLTVLWALARRALTASSISPASLFRVIEAFAPTFLLDEMDNARLMENDELRALLNSGHTRGTAGVLRTVGEDHIPRWFSTWCLVALAAIGDLPDTVTSRGIVLRLQRKPRDKSVTRLRESRLHAELEPLRRKLVRWAADHGPAIAEADPDLPPQLDGRTADNWGGLIALADEAGGKWPERAREAALVLSGEMEEGEGTPGVLLLADLRALFADRGTDRLSSETDIVPALTKLEGRPWPEWKAGKPITARGVARLLKPFGIEPQQVRFDEETRKGYLREWFEDVWSRYLPPNPKQAKQAANDTASTLFSEVKHDSPVSDQESASDPHEQRSVSLVSDTEGMEDDDPPPPEVEAHGPEPDGGARA